MTVTEEKTITIGGLTTPDLRPYFKHLHWRPMPHSMGVPVASDWADKTIDDPVFGLYKNCGLWTMDEAAILYNVVRQVKGNWLDIGAHTGWTAAHVLEAGGAVMALEPMLRIQGFADRINANIGTFELWESSYLRSDEYFEIMLAKDLPSFDGVIIDGDHDRPHPMRDAVNAATHLAETGVILMHDFTGKPVREAVTWLMDHGFHCRVYWTPHMVACCWRGEFHPPVYYREPRIPWHIVRAQLDDFDFKRCI